MPVGLTAAGQGKFRSENPGGHYFDKIAGQAAASHWRGVPFFQQTLKLKPRQNYLLIAHRKQRSGQVFDLGENLSISSEDMLQLVLSLWPIARHSKGDVDLYAIKAMAAAHVSRGALRSAAQFMWNAIRPMIRSLPH